MATKAAAAAIEAASLGSAYSDLLMSQLDASQLGRYTKGAEKRVSEANTKAVVSAAAYIYAKDEDRAQEFIDKHAPGYTIRHDLSDHEHVVMVKGNDVEISFRGTDTGNIDDLYADKDIALMGMDYSGSERFDRALQVYREVRVTLGGDKNYSVTGHSLGGSQAMWVARHNPEVKAVVFNPGIVGPTSNQRWGGVANAMASVFGMRNHNDGEEYDNIEVLRMDGDIVSGGYYSRMGGNMIKNMKDEDGKMLMEPYEVSNALNGTFAAMAPPSRWVRPDGDHGIDLVNARYDDPEVSEGSLKWLLKAHGLDNFLTPEQSVSFNDMSGFGEEEASYAERLAREHEGDESKEDGRRQRVVTVPVKPRFFSGGERHKTGETMQVVMREPGEHMNVLSSNPLDAHKAVFGGGHHFGGKPMIPTTEHIGQPHSLHSRAPETHNMIRAITKKRKAEKLSLFRQSHQETTAMRTPDYAPRPIQTAPRPAEAAPRPATFVPWGQQLI